MRECKHEPDWEVAKHFPPGQFRPDDGQFWSSFKCKHCRCDGEMTIKVFKHKDYEWYDQDPEEEVNG